MTRLKYSLLLPLIATLINCTATGLGDASLEQRRQNVLTMRQEVLAELYGLKPDTQSADRQRCRLRRVHQR